MDKHERIVIVLTVLFSVLFPCLGQNLTFIDNLRDPVEIGIAKSIQTHFDCPLVSNRMLEPLYQDEESTGMLSFDWTTPKNSNFKEDYMMSIRKTEVCVIGLVFGSNPNELELVADLTERVPHSKLVVMGASLDLITKIKRQVMVLEVDQMSQNVKVNIYCGRQRGGYWNKIVNIWTTKRGFAKNLTWNDYCSHILDHQRFIVGHSGQGPMVILPREPGDEIRGVEVDVMKLLAQKHHLDLDFIFGVMGVAGPHTNHSNDLLEQVYRNEIDLAITVALHVDGYKFFECTTYTDILELKYCTRRPQKLVDFGNLGRGFDFWSWILVFTCLSLFSCTFALIFYVYKRKIGLMALYKDPGNPIDFFLLTFTAFVEPDPLVWFPSWSSGKTLFLLWSLFAFLITSFYNSNLRGNLIAPSLEPRIETTDDFLNSGRDLLLLDILTFLLKQKSGTGFQRFLDYVEANPSSLYSLNDDLDAVTDKIMSGGAVIICPKDSEMINYPKDPVNMGLPNRHFSRESIFSGFTANRLKKYSPYLPSLNDAIERFRESGLNQKALYEQLPLVALPGQFQPDQNVNEIKMSLGMLWMAIFILAGGMGLGLAAFILEVTIAWRNSSMVEHLTCRKKWKHREHL